MPRVRTVVVLPAAVGPRKPNTSPGSDLERQLGVGRPRSEAFGQTNDGERWVIAVLVGDDLPELRHAGNTFPSTGSGAALAIGRFPGAGWEGATGVRGHAIKSVRPHRSSGWSTSTANEAAAATALCGRADIWRR